MDLSSKFWSPLIWLLEKLNPDPYEKTSPKDYRILGTYDQMARVPRNRLTYYYLLIGQETMSLLNEVYNIERYVRPSDELNHKYLVLIELLDKLKNLKYDPLNIFDFKKYPDLFQSNSTQDNFWEVDGVYHTPRFYTEMQVDLNGGVTVLPDDLENLFRETKELLVDFRYQKDNKTQYKKPTSVSELPKTFHWDKSGKEYIFDKNHSLKFTAEKSKKIKFFKSLVNEDGGWVSNKDTTKNLRIKDGDIRSMVSQLKNNIKTQNVIKFIRIDTNNNGSYKLTSKI